MVEYKPFDRIEQHILDVDSGSILWRWKWGRLAVCNPTLTHPDGRLKKGSIDTLIAKAADHGSKLSRAEVQRRVQCAKTYPTEAQIASVRRQFDNWWSLRKAGFLDVEAPEDAQPYDPRAPYKKREDAERQLNRILKSPEANGQQPLPGLRIYLPGFTQDTVTPETVFREAFKIHRYICEEVTPQLRNAADQAERDDRERGAKLDQLFEAVNRNLEATLAEGEAALLDD